MRTSKGLLAGGAALILFLFLSVEMLGQGRERGRGRGHEKHEAYDRAYGHRDGHDHRHTRERTVIVHHHRPVYVHQHHHSCEHRRVIRHVERPRYIYYRDYDVYFDLHRNMYISYSGRGWRMSRFLPPVMERVDVRRAHCVQVDYYDDGFIDYLGHGRPVYGPAYVWR